MEWRMTVYVDDMYKYSMGRFGRMKMSHMITDAHENELHTMANKIGVARKWYQGDHYDISITKRALAIKFGAIAITLRELAWLNREKQMKVPVWSYSFLSTYDRCPSQAAAKYVNKTYPYEKENEALRWGNAVHDGMEHRINNNVRLPNDMQQWECFVEDLPKVEAELKLGVRKDYSPCGFFDKDVYGRGKLDVPIIDGDVGFIFDWKTGKEWEDPLELKIGAVLLKAKYPQLKEIVGAYCWLKENKWGQVYDLSDTDSTQKWIDETMEKAARSNFWTPKRNALCSWCSLTDCPYYKDKPMYPK